MRIYLAGVQKSYISQLPQKMGVLCSYEQPRQTRLIPALHEQGHDILLDSGAFATWNSGKPEQCPILYAGFVNSIKDKIAGAVALDVIGGSADSQLKNLDDLSFAKNKILPVFHEGDDWELLNEYIQRGHKYIALGAIESRGSPNITKWLDQVFERFPPGVIKYHGLAMTQRILIKEYSGHFESVDSTTWLAFQKWGIENNKYLLKNRSPEFYRRLGIMAIQDMYYKDGGVSKHHAYQTNMFDWL